jgi:hypothetical protein
LIYTIELYDSFTPIFDWRNDTTHLAGRVQPFDAGVDSLPPTDEPSSTAEPSPTTEPSPTAELSPATFETFTSKRHGYSIEYPDSWLVTEKAGEWESGDLLYQHAAGVDAFSAPGDSDMVVIGSQPVPDAAERVAAFA